MEQRKSHIPSRSRDPRAATIRPVPTIIGAPILTPVTPVQNQATGPAELKKITITKATHHTLLEPAPAIIQPNSTVTAAVKKDKDVEEFEVLAPVVDVVEERIEDALEKERKLQDSVLQKISDSVHEINKQPIVNVEQDNKNENRQALSKLRKNFGPFGTKFVLDNAKNIINKYYEDETISRAEKLRIFLSMVHISSLQISASVEELIYTILTDILWNLYNNLETINERVKCAAFLHPRFDEAIYRRRSIEEDLLRLAKNTADAERYDALDFLRSKFYNIHPDNRKQADALFNESPFDDAKGVGLGKTYAEDSQNVHNSTLHKGIEQALLDLSYDEVPWRMLKDNNRRYQSISDVMDEILNTVSGSERWKISRSLERIFTDHIEFKYKLTLRDVLQRVWNRMKNMPECKEELIKRMVQELMESTGMCATGLLGRMLNILSGFDPEKGGLDLLTVGWEDEIYGAYKARVEKILKALPEDDYNQIIEDIGTAKNKDNTNFAWQQIQIASRKVYQELLAEYKPMFGVETVPNLPILTQATTDTTKPPHKVSFDQYIQQSIDKFIGA